MENYFNAFLITMPAILILVPLPIWSLHRRIRTAKRNLITEIDEEIRNASKIISGDELQKLNALLQRCEQIQKLRNWPMGLTIVSRFALYVFIPPLAWAGAALMEVYLDRFI